MEVYIIFRDGAVPASLVGDGFQSICQTLFGVSAVRNGVALVEEPETYLHPAAICVIAAALVKVAAHTQLFVTTHSLELIDALIRASVADGVEDRLALYNVALRDRQLAHVRYRGDTLESARFYVERDLR